MEWLKYATVPRGSGHSRNHSREFRQSFTVSDVLSRLRKVKPSGRGWTACCPAHDDRNPSLSIAEGDNGLVLLKCFAGCSYEAIRNALGLSRDSTARCARTSLARQPKPIANASNSVAFPVGLGGEKGNKQTGALSYGNDPAWFSDLAEHDPDPATEDFRAALEAWDDDRREWLEERAIIGNAKIGNGL